MNFFRKLFNKQPKEQKNMLESIPSWQISPPADPVELFKNLKKITPENSTLYFEDVYDNKVKQIFKTISVDNKILEGGTLWPKPDAYHIPATEENYKKIQEIAENHPLSVHFHTHKNNEKILEWYDAFDKDPIYRGLSNQSRCVFKITYFLRVPPLPRLLNCLNKINLPHMNGSIKPRNVSGTEIYPASQVSFYSGHHKDVGPHNQSPHP